MRDKNGCLGADGHCKVRRCGIYKCCVEKKGALIATKRAVKMDYQVKMPIAIFGLILLLSFSQPEILQ